MQLANLELGNPSMKSSEIVCHAPSGIGKGDSNPRYLALLGLAC
jgi:hypothetical protein